MTQQNQTQDWSLRRHVKFTAVIGALLASVIVADAQSNMTIYADSLTNGWEDYSYNTTRNFANTSSVHSGNDSISATITAAYGGIQLYHPPMSDGAYGNVSFWLNGGAIGGQQLQMYGNEGTGPTGQSARYPLVTPVANTWLQYTVPLASLGVANVTNFSGFAIQDSADAAEPTFYLDDIQLVSAAVPAVTQLTVNANQPIRTADARWFGVNSPIWDTELGMPQTQALLTNMGVTSLRFPGGSDSDDFHWLFNRQDSNTWTWNPVSLASFIQLITNLNAGTMITLNYGTGTSNEAAAWVAYVNAVTNNTQVLGTDSAGFNWNTAGYWASIRAAKPLGTDDGKNFLRIARAAPLSFKYWEIGNEEYGSWETDSNSIPHDPYTYAVRSAGYIGLMKAVDPTIKIGVVVTPGASSYVNNYNHPAVDPVTGQTNYGWTPVLLATLNSLGVTPDFAIYHNYPQNPGSESDAGLLGTSGLWVSAAGSLRSEITDYMGAKGTNIELVCTENNSVSSAPGKQSVSLVNGLYKVDSLAQLMQTEFNGLFWWALRNGIETDGNLSSNLYGWRIYGDYGVVSGYTNLYPTYYTTELMQHFAQTGDTVLTAASSYSLLSTYAMQRLDGSLTVLTINKTPTNTLTGQVLLTGFTPATNGTVYSYGIPQDNAVETGVGSRTVAQSGLSGVGTNFTYAFPPYSASVMVFSPTPAKLLSVSTPPSASQLVFQLQGQVGVPYVIQRSTNLNTWLSISTNVLVTSPMNITNPLAPSTTQQFWRAIWQP